jgi:glycosyltransferase involved in cell wall biosynthesis
LKFSIVTPSFRSSQWLRLCIPSVADQQDVELEHIVQDSCSDDATKDWLSADPRVKAFIEKDQGMYDAVNRGFRRSAGDILAYLNCDEQYLPGALKAVSDYFQAHPQMDIVISDTIVTDSEGKYICHRYSLVPNKSQIWIRFSVVSCALFVRRRVVQDLGICFDTKWRDVGDFFWVNEMVKRGLKMAVLPRFTSVFTETGENMNLKPNARRESSVRWQMAPGWVKFLRFGFALEYRLRLAARGSLLQKPFDYSLYTLAAPNERTIQRAAKPTSFWKRRASVKVIS